MSVQEYSARRHELNALKAKQGGGRMTPELAKLLQDNGWFSARSTSNVNAKSARNRRLRLAQAEADMRPAPKARPLRPVDQEACSSVVFGGMSFDPAPVCHAVDGAPAPTGAATRINVQSTPRQRRERLARAEASLRR